MNGGFAFLVESCGMSAVMINCMMSQEWNDDIVAEWSKALDLGSNLRAQVRILPMLFFLSFGSLYFIHLVALSFNFDVPWSSTFLLSFFSVHKNYSSTICAVIFHVALSTACT